jgi:hypothetical protein
VGGNGVVGHGPGAAVDEEDGLDGDVILRCWVMQDYWGANWSLRRLVSV